MIHISSDINKQRFSHFLRTAGIGFLFISTVFFIFIVGIVRQYGLKSIPGLLFGGILGLCYILIYLGRPAVFGTLFSPPKVLQTEEDLHRYMIRYRKKWLIIVSTLPYHMWLFYLLLVSQKNLSIDIGVSATASIFSFLFTVGIAAGVQYIQVLWSLSINST